MKHELYKDSDTDAPRAIKDVHDDVVLDLCKNCGGGERELIDNPVCPGKNRYPEILAGNEWREYSSAGDGVAILDNWFLTVVTKNPYQAPETGTLVLGGNVFNHCYFDQGAEITTSKPVSVDPQFPDVVITKSGSRYFLGRVAEEYESQYPGARKRLFNSLAGVRENDKI